MISTSTLISELIANGYIREARVLVRLAVDKSKVDEEKLKAKIKRWEEAKTDRAQQLVAKQFKRNELEEFGKELPNDLLQAITKYHRSRDIKQLTKKIIETKGVQADDTDAAGSADAAEKFFLEAGLSDEDVDKVSVDKVRVTLPIGAVFTFAFARDEVFLTEKNGDKSKLHLSNKLMQQVAELYQRQAGKLKQRGIEKGVLEDAAAVDPTEPKSVGDFLKTQKIEFQISEGNKLVVDLPGEGGLVFDTSDQTIHMIEDGKVRGKFKLNPANLAEVVSLYKRRAKENGAGEDVSVEEGAGEEEQTAKEVVDQQLVKMQKALRPIAKMSKTSPARTPFVRTMSKIDNAREGLVQLLEDPDLDENTKLVIETYSDLLKGLNKSFLRGLRVGT